MKRDILEQQITEALDGTLKADQLRRLEAELREWPELEEQYEKLKSDTSVSLLEESFPEIMPDPGRLMFLRSHLENPFYSAAVVLFKRYFLAATILITVLASGTHFLMQQESEVADYQLYEWIYDNNYDSFEEESETWLFTDLEEE